MFYFISNKTSFIILYLSIRRHFWRLNVLVLKFWEASVFYDTYTLYDEPLSTNLFYGKYGLYETHWWQAAQYILQEFLVQPPQARNSIEILSAVYIPK